MGSLLTLLNKTCAYYQYLNEKIFSKVTHTITSIFIEKYQEKLLTNKKRLIYKEVKHKHLFEPYLSYVTDI